MSATHCPRCARAYELGRGHKCPPNVHTDAPATLRAKAAELHQMADRGSAQIITCDTVTMLRSAAGSLEWAAQHISTGWPPSVSQPATEHQGE